MDKVKEIFYQVFVKHRFWTLSVVVMAMGLVGWWLSAGSLQGDYTKNKGEISGARDKIRTISQTPLVQVVNDTTHAGMEAMIQQRKKDVYLAWLEKYRKQRELLVWPSGLSQRFVQRIQNVLDGRPIEEVNPRDDGTDHLTFNLREEYRNEIKSLLPQLAKTINAPWTPTDGASREGRLGGPVVPRGGVGEGAAGEPEGPKYTVQWNAANQSEIELGHFDWPEAERQLPSTFEILYSMEDYWVLKALMQIVARTNALDGVDRMARADEAAIREIDFIHIGKLAESNAGTISRIAATVGPGGEGVAEGGGATPPPYTATEGGLSGEGGSNPLGLQVDPAEGRYVSGPKGSYQPISGETLRTAAESEDKEQAYLAVAKRMPVRMRVKIDQRKLNKFLVECGNADLMLEVKQVRINPDASHILTGAAASTPARGGGGYGGGFRGGEGGGSFGSGSDTQEYPWDIVVEVYGIIYIFNPPSLQRLQLTADEAAEFDREAARYSSSPAGEAADGPAADDQPADDERDEEGPGGPPAAAAPPAEAARNETPAADAAS